MIKGKSEGLQLEDNNIFRYGNSNIVVRLCALCCIVLCVSHSKSSTCSNGLDGVMLANEAVCSIQHNAIFDNRGVGIQILSRAAPHISQTSVYNNRGGGIVIGKTGNAHLSACEVFANGGSSGISISKGDDATVVVVQGCEVFSNTPYGIEVKVRERVRPAFRAFVCADSLVHSRVRPRSCLAIVCLRTVWVCGLARMRSLSWKATKFSRAP